MHAVMHGPAYSFTLSQLAFVAAAIAELPSGAAGPGRVQGPGYQVEAL